MSETPFIAIGADELGAQLPAQIKCPMCSEMHDIKDSWGTDRNGNRTSMSLQSYLCGDKVYLAGIDGRAIPTP